MAQLRLKDKSIVIIGGTTGLGLAAASAFVAEGARVVVVGRKAAAIEAAQKALAESGRAIAGDASHPETAARAIALAVENYGSFHGLYHVAGGSGRQMGDGALHTITDEGWRGTLELNLTSVAFSNRAAVQQFI